MHLDIKLTARLPCGCVLCSAQEGVVTSEDQRLALQHRTQRDLERAIEVHARFHACQPLFPDSPQETPHG